MSQRSPELKSSGKCDDLKKRGSSKIRHSRKFSGDSNDPLRNSNSSHRPENPPIEEDVSSPRFTQHAHKSPDERSPTVPRILTRKSTKAKRSKKILEELGIQQPNNDLLNKAIDLCIFEAVFE